ncbi:hypothetical protein [Moraxella oblonga]|uniref:hypothetical protein n=1 Tax=Moraxella oblonga TaxID=200413 RepID=UPI00082C34D7|nr:hypothetical protein [Moraxella oblonga]
MIVLDLPQETIQVIEQVAQKNGQSIQDFITISAYEKALQSFAKPKDDELLIDFIQNFPKSQLTRSGLEIQKELRDEWD